MRYERLRVCVVIGVELGCGGHRPSTPTPARPVVMKVPRPPVASTFGKAENGEIKKTSHFEVGRGTTYAWRIKLPCTGPTLFRETLQMPSAGEWLDLDARAVHVSADQTRAVTTGYAPCLDGWIEHGWTSTEHDPIGEYVITVEIDGVAPQVFRATFVPSG